MPLSNVDEREALLIFADDAKTIRRLEEFLRTTQKSEVDELIEHFWVVADNPLHRHLIGGHGTDAERLSAVRAALINQTSRRLPSWMSLCNMASTGVTPMPADIKITGVASSVRTNSPRGAATSMTCPARICSVR